LAISVREPAEERGYEHLRIPDRDAGQNRHSQFPWDGSRESRHSASGETLSGTARDALLAYAMTGSAVASIVMIAAPHLEVLLRCIFHGRG